jgi:hypothetical protein
METGFPEVVASDWKWGKPSKPVINRGCFRAKMLDDG